jgi:hypothetical protein
VLTDSVAYSMWWTVVINKKRASMLGAITLLIAYIAWNLFNAIIGMLLGAHSNSNARLCTGVSMLTRAPCPRPQPRTIMLPPTLSNAAHFHPLLLWTHLTFCV